MFQVLVVELGHVIVVALRPLGPPATCVHWPPEGRRAHIRLVGEVELRWDSPVVHVRLMRGRVVRPYPNILVASVVSDFGHPRSPLPLPHADVPPMRWRRRQVG